jgi:hypothetical protein
MKPESMRKVAEAMRTSGLDVEAWGDDVLAELAGVAIRAVMQTPEVRGLVGALQFYADDKNWHPEEGYKTSQTDEDIGRTARSALTANHTEDKLDMVTALEEKP